MNDYELENMKRKEASERFLKILKGEYVPESYNPMSREEYEEYQERMQNEEIKAHMRKQAEKNKVKQERSNSFKDLINRTFNNDDCNSAGHASVNVNGFSSDDQGDILHDMERFSDLSEKLKSGTINGNEYNEYLDLEMKMNELIQDIYDKQAEKYREQEKRIELGINKFNQFS